MYSFDALADIFLISSRAFLGLFKFSKTCLIVIIDNLKLSFSLILNLFLEL